MPTRRGESFLWDTEVPGLGIRATNRVKAYIFQGKLKHKALDGTIKREAIRVKIGDVRSWVLDQNDPSKPHGARQEARRLQSLLDQGIDPRIEKQERVAEQEAKREAIQRADVTVGEAWAVYVERRNTDGAPAILPTMSGQHKPEGRTLNGERARQSRDRYTP